MPARSLLVASAVLALLAFPRANAVDTSEWLCETCPFVSGAGGEYSVGLTHVSDDAARFGNANGYDEEGLYANVGGEGHYRSDQLAMRWALEELGLDSRAASLDAGLANGLDLRLDYSELPYREFDTAATVFTIASDGRLTLPSNWQTAGVTGGFSALGSSLRPVATGHDRRHFGLGGRMRVSSQISISADFRRRAIEGNDVLGGASFTQASLLPRAIDQQTDEIDLGATWRGERSLVSLSWMGSRFRDLTRAVVWDNPFTAVPGAEAGQLAQPPENSLSQFTAKGQLRFDQYNAVVNASAALGRLEQDEALLPYTINPLLTQAALPARTLDGRVDTSTLGISLSARPLDKARLRLSWRRNERDNRTPVRAWERVIVDSFESGESEFNSPYSFRRDRFTAAGDYELFDSLRLSAGATRKRMRRDFQEVASQTETSGWGGLRWRPKSGIEVGLRAGNDRREIDSYDESAAIAFGQNPLLRKYNLAYRYREYARLRASASLTDIPVSFSASARYSDDSYTQSVLGLLYGRELALSGDADWNLGTRTTINAHLGWHGIESEQAGSEGFAGVDWRAVNDDEFRSAGIGLRVSDVVANTDLELNYLRTKGESDVRMSTVGGPSVFPAITSTRDSLRLALRYRGSGRMDGTLALRYESLDNNDWALLRVQPATIPEVLTLGADPFNYDVFLVSVGLTYRLGAPASESD